MSVRIKDSDRGFRKLQETLKRAKLGGGVTVGVHAAEGAEQHGDVAKGITTDKLGRHHPAGKFISKKKAAELKAKSKTTTGVTVLDVAIWNEFGLGVPERSFVRAWAIRNDTAIRDKIRSATRLYLKRKVTFERMMNLLGLSFVGGIQKTIAAGIDPPNAISTFLKKGSSTPLIATGQLRQSVTYKVVPTSHP